jgi:hypothetical protein
MTTPLSAAAAAAIAAHPSQHDSALQCCRLSDLTTQAEPRLLALQVLQTLHAVQINRWVCMACSCSWGWCLPAAHANRHTAWSSQLFLLLPAATRCCSCKEEAQPGAALYQPALPAAATSCHLLLLLMQRASAARSSPVPASSSCCCHKLSPPAAAHAKRKRSPEQHCASQLLLPPVTSCCCCQLSPSAAAHANRKRRSSSVSRPSASASRPAGRTSSSSVEKVRQGRIVYDVCNTKQAQAEQGRRACCTFDTGSAKTKWVLPACTHDWCETVMNAQHASTQYQQRSGAQRNLNPQPPSPTQPLDSPTVPSNTACFFSCSLRMRSSMVPATTKRVVRMGLYCTYNRRRGRGGVGVWVTAAGGVPQELCQ